MRATPLTDLSGPQWNRNGAGGGLMSFAGASETIVEATLSPSLCRSLEATTDTTAMA
ncbi:MAG: hypothetical protein ABSF82_04580 [Candidatus Bathyarchaeia archaeon]